MGIEPTSSAWKAEVLPLNYTRHTDPRLRVFRTASHPFVTPGALVGSRLTSHQRRTPRYPLERLKVLSPTPLTPLLPASSPLPSGSASPLPDGGGRIRTYEGCAGRFTVCSR